DALGIHAQGLFVLGSQRVVEPEALDVTAVARAALVGRHQVVEGALLGAATAQTDSHHEIRSSIKNMGPPCGETPEKSRVFYGNLEKREGVTEVLGPGNGPFKAQKAQNSAIPAVPVIPAQLSRTKPRWKPSLQTPHQFRHPSPCHLFHDLGELVVLLDEPVH